MLVSYGSHFPLPSMWKCRHSSANSNASAGDDSSMEEGQDESSSKRGSDHYM